jgi:hypothetical protein
MTDISWGQFSVASGGWLLFALTAITLLRMVMKGRLVPRQTLEDALHDRDEWRAESRIKDSQLATKDQHLAHLAEVGETQKMILRSLGSPTPQEGT